MAELSARAVPSMDAVMMRNPSKENIADFTSRVQVSTSRPKIGLLGVYILYSNAKLLPCGGVQNEDESSFEKHPQCVADRHPTVQGKAETVGPPPRRHVQPCNAPCYIMLRPTQSLGYIGVILGIYNDNGKENGNC